MIKAAAQIILLVALTFHICKDISSFGVGFADADNSVLQVAVLLIVK